MSGRYLVMPRGINVGTRNRVPMAELRSKLTEAGHSDPVTILQSGNVIITSDCADAAALASSIEQLLAAEFGVNVPCLTRTAEHVQAVLERDPLGDVADDGSRHLVNFNTHGLARQGGPSQTSDLTCRGLLAPTHGTS